MPKKLNPAVQSCIIPYTLLSTFRDENEAITCLKAFIENLTISRHWKRQSFECDFSGLFQAVLNFNSSILFTNTLRFIRPTTERFSISIPKNSSLISIRKAAPHPLVGACNANRRDLFLQLLMQPGIDFSVGNNHLIKWACKEGDLQIVRLLLEKPNFNPFIRDNYPLQLASQNGHPEIVKLLLTHPKVNPSAGDNFAIKRASLNGHIEVVRLLLEKVGIQGAQKALEQEPLDQEIRKVLLEYLH